MKQMKQMKPETHTMKHKQIRTTQQPLFKKPIRSTKPKELEKLGKLDRLPIALISGNSVKTYLHLFQASGHGTTAVLSGLDEIAAGTGLTTRTTRACIRELRDQDLITRDLTVNRSPKITLL